MDHETLIKGKINDPLIFSEILDKLHFANHIIGELVPYGCIKNKINKAIEAIDYVNRKINFGEKAFIDQETEEAIVMHILEQINGR